MQKLPQAYPMKMALRRMSTTTFHSEFPTPGIPAQYGFEVFEAIPDPNGACDKSDPNWDFYDQWRGHKIGGAPSTYAVGADRVRLHALLQDGYELLLMMGEPSYNLVDWKQCDDYSGDWLCVKARLNVLIHPRTMDMRYTWG